MLCLAKKPETYDGTDAIIQLCHYHAELAAGWITGEGSLLGCLRSNQRCALWWDISVCLPVLGEQLLHQAAASPSTRPPALWGSQTVCCMWGKELNLAFVQGKQLPEQGEDGYFPPQPGSLCVGSKITTHPTAQAAQSHCSQSTFTYKHIRWFICRKPARKEPVEIHLAISTCFWPWLLP